MIQLKNYFKHTSGSVKKLSLWLRGVIGTLSLSAYVQNDIKIGFYLLIAGALIDLLLQLLPPDTEVKPGAKVLLFVVGLSAIATTMVGCLAKRPLVEHSYKDTTSVTYKQVDYHYQGAKVTTGLNLDSLFKAALVAKEQHREDSTLRAESLVKYKADSTAAVKAGKSVPPAPKLPVAKPSKSYVTDPETKAQLSYWVDQYGKLQLGCESKDKTLQMLVAQVNRLQQEKTKIIQTVYRVPKWMWYLLIASLLVNLALIIYARYKRALNTI